jgi:hypothetical protein
MPKIFDNITTETQIITGLSNALESSVGEDFCIGYFNLRGWRLISDKIKSCRLMIGMQEASSEQLVDWLVAVDSGEELENTQQQAIVCKQQIAEDFRNQLLRGYPNNDDEKGLATLADQLESGRLKVKLFLRHKLHAKLYLIHRTDGMVPVIGLLGSSNLTFAGLSKQGELNIDVTENDAAAKLQHWFDDRWNDRLCIDISQELASIIRNSWAREKLIPPYLVYMKMIYHLSQEARIGMIESVIPAEFRDVLFDFQTAAVKMAARYLRRRKGVILGDVVGLGKTVMGTALARIMHDEAGLKTLIICPAKLTNLWKDYAERYDLMAKVLSIGNVQRELPKLNKYGLVLIDESHNFRNPEGARYQAVRNYIEANDSYCILLSATPYNKNFIDLSSQLKLFWPEDKDLGIRPEALISQIGISAFNDSYQCNPRTLKAFEKSDHKEDWRELMRLFLVRRTRNFIKDNYASTDPDGRAYLKVADGRKFYFPNRVPKTIKLAGGADDPYRKLYSSSVVDVISSLILPRYGLKNYLLPTLPQLTAAEKKIVDNLSRAGNRLIGFCRTGLFKRLESGGPAFLLSLQRHILRNYVIVYAIDNGLDIPIGSQDVELMTQNDDDDSDSDLLGATSTAGFGSSSSESDYMDMAKDIYQTYSSSGKKKFKWFRSDLFRPELKKDLCKDAVALADLLRYFGTWDPAQDSKLKALTDLVCSKHSSEKILIFTQFADTADYLNEQLKGAGLKQLASVTGDSEEPTETVWAFSPISSGKEKFIKKNNELRVLISTDVLSEGQNLQDCRIVVNYDLPWAIIRLIQRAGRVDRIGQQAEQILCYSFMPADGVESIIRLRARVKKRLEENAEVVGSDEAFFEDEEIIRKTLSDLYSEKNGALDEEDDQEDVDLASYAYQIWKSSVNANPELEKAVTSLPDVCYSTKAHQKSADSPDGVLVYLKNGENADLLVRVDSDGNTVTQSHLAVIKAAECSIDTQAIPRSDKHHELVRIGVKDAIRTASASGHLGPAASPRSRIYELLTSFMSESASNRRRPGQTRLYDMDETDALRLKKAVDLIYNRPLTSAAANLLVRQFKEKADTVTLAQIVLELYDNEELCIAEDERRREESRIICSMGLFPKEDA